MASKRDSEANRKKLVQLDRAIRKILDEILQSGFYGTAQVVLNVQDGTIQHLRRMVEQVER